MIHKTTVSKIISRTGLSFLILLYAFSPVWLGNNFVFQNQTGLTVVITVLSAAGCACILIKRIYVSSILKLVTWLDLSVFGYFAYLLLQLFFYPVSSEYVLKILCLPLLYFLFRQVPVRHASGLLYLLPILTIVHIIYGYNCLAYPWQGISNVTGGFTNTGIFGGFVAMGFVSALGLLLSSKRPVVRIVLGVLLIPVTVQLIFSNSRAAYVAAVAGTLILSIPAFRKLTKWKAVIFVSALLIACALFSIKLYHLRQDSVDGRLLIWTVGGNMFTEKPITGFGPNGFQKNYPLRQGEYFKTHPDSPSADLAGDISSPFNEWLKTGVEQGIIGLLFVFGIFFMAFGNTTSPPVLRATAAALILFACFSYPFDFVAFQVLGMFCIASIASAQKSIGIARLSALRPFKNIAVKVVATCLIAITGGIILYVSLSSYGDIKNWNRTIYSFSPDDEQKITGLQTLYPALKRNAPFDFVYGSALFDAERYREAIPLLEESKELFPSSETFVLLGETYEKTGDYIQALNAWDTASYIKPALFTPHYDMAKLYFKMGDYKLAKQKAGEILSKKVKVNTPKIDQIKKEMQTIYTSDY